MKNDSDKKSHYFGDDFFEEARMAAPIAKAIVERIKGKGALDFDNPNRNNVRHENKAGKELLRKIKMRKLNKVFAILMLVFIIAEVFAFINGKMVFPADFKYIAIVIIGYIYTKIKSK